MVCEIFRPDLAQRDCVVTFHDGIVARRTIAACAVASLRVGECYLIGCVPSSDVQAATRNNEAARMSDGLLWRLVS